LDDIRFQPNATPEFYAGELARDGRYSWAWMVRWLPYPSGSVQPRVLEYTVVVYQNRKMTSTVDATPVGEYSYAATYTAPNLVTVPYSGGVRPAIKKGGWILDGTPGNGYFYRVNAIQDTGAALILTTQTPLRGLANNPSAVVFMDNVVEVFERSM